MSRILTLALAVLQGSASVVLPPPGGSFPVGQTRWVVEDTRRTDPFTTGQSRKIEIVVWYPAADGARGRPVPYLASGLDEARAFGAVFGDRTLFDGLAEIVTHSIADAPPRAGREPLPLLFFSHGYTSVGSSATALMEDLASRGYVVISTVHPFEAAAATVGSGAIVTMVDEAGKFRQPILDVFAEWKDEDKVLADVTAADDDAERIKLLRGYVATLRNTHVALQRWVDDTRAVVAALPGIDPGSPLGRVVRRADVSKLGVAGHSMGGVAAAEYCLGEPRCAAVLNLDGSPQYGRMLDERLGRPLMMVYSARNGRRGASDVIYKRSASKYYRADVAGALHLDFTDMALWPPLAQRNALGPLDPTRKIAITRTLVREFFDQELRGRPSALLAGKEQMPDVTIR